MTIIKMLQKCCPNFYKMVIVCVNITIAAIILNIIIFSYGGLYYKQSLLPGQKEMLPAVILLVILLIARHFLKLKDRAGIRQDRLVKLLNNKKWVALALLLVLVFGFYSMYRQSWSMSADSKLYYVYLRSMFFDGDLNFTNDYMKMGGPLYSMNHQTGYWNNPFAVGCSILWFPSFLTGHLYAKSFGYPADGYSEFPYGISINLGGLFLAWIGLVLLVSTLQKFFDSKIALLIPLTIWYGTPLTFYTNQQPNLDTALSFFTGSLFLYLYFHLAEKPTTQKWIALGITAGICMLVRPQNVILLIIPAVLLLNLFIKAIKQKKKKDVLSLFRWGSLLAIFTIVTFLPQMLVWQVMYNSPVTIPQGDHWMEWGNPKITQVLFSSNHGLFTWTPILILGVIGLAFFFIKDRWNGSALFLAFAAMVYINSVPNDWWGGSAFGGRRFSSTFPILAIGLASLLKPFFDKKLFRYAVIAVLLAAIMWNCSLISIFSDNTIPHQGIIKTEMLYSLIKNRAAEIISSTPSLLKDSLFVMFNRDACRECRNINIKPGETIISIGDESPFLRNGWSAIKDDPVMGLPYRSASRSILSIHFYLSHVPKNGISININCRSVNRTASMVPVMNGTPIKVFGLSGNWKDYNFKIAANLLQEGINLLRFDSFKERLKRPKTILQSFAGECLEVLRVNITLAE
jgi:hypothetical protein